jgi:glycosyltransferase involved in cell wall biosynthesis
LKILHVVTFLDGQRSYGGPLTVALNLAKEQINQGHSVVLIALSDRTDKRLDGKLEIRTFKAMKILGTLRFSSMISFSALRWLKMNSTNFDAVHLHFSRDIFQVWASWVAVQNKTNVFLQTHGMITNTVASKKPIQDIYDLLFVKPILRRVNGVLALNESERNSLLDLCPGMCAYIVPNGIRFNSFEPGQPEKVQVAFISRLHSQKNPLLFVSAAKHLITNGLNARFLIAGPDGGQAAAVESEVESFNSKSLRYLGPIDHDQVHQTLRASSLLVLPSVNEPFGMILLEAFSNGVPVVVSDSCQIAPEVKAYGLGETTSPTTEDVARAIEVRLAKSGNRTQIYLAAKNLFDLGPIVSKLTKVYEAKR